jgi:hypothetical protein
MNNLDWTHEILLSWTHESTFIKKFTSPFLTVQEISEYQTSNQGSYAGESFITIHVVHAAELGSVLFKR